MALVNLIAAAGGLVPVGQTTMVGLQESLVVPLPNWPHSFSPHSHNGTVSFNCETVPVGRLDPSHRGAPEWRHLNRQRMRHNVIRSDAELTIVISY